MASRSAYHLFLAIGIAGPDVTAGYLLVDAYAYIRFASKNAFEKARTQNASQSEKPESVGEGGVLGEMEIPRLGLKTIVVQGDSERTLRRAVGHIPGYGVPGPIPAMLPSPATATASFGRCEIFDRADIITFKTRTAEFRYQVESTSVVLPA